MYNSWSVVGNLKLTLQCLILVVTAQGRPLVILRNNIEYTLQLQLLHNWHLSVLSYFTVFKNRDT